MSSQLKKVLLKADIYMVCLQHALSTESFEVMGLLIGNNVDGISTISAAIILRRSDKKKDRVEISSDQLLKATTEAERLTEQLKKPMRVLGWYHSHPNITVFPSRIDCGTQEMYQTMDSCFVGLIFSVFTGDSSAKEQEVILTCFQSVDGSSKEIPLEIEHSPDISPNSSKTMAESPKILIQEEDDMACCCNKQDILISLYNEAVQTRALAHITDVITRPLVQTLHYRLKLNETRKKFLKNQISSYNKEIQNIV